MIQPPPRPTLFPYTTLFRSGPKPCFDGSISRRMPSRPAISSAEKVRYGLQVGSGGRNSTRLAFGLSKYIGRRDRKSTRLNSSHPSISYAVFCLKKKNSTENV